MLKQTKTEGQKNAATYESCFALQVILNAVLQNAPHALWGTLIFSRVTMVLENSFASVAHRVYQASTFFNGD